MRESIFIGVEINSRPPYYTLIGIDANQTCQLDFSGNWEELMPQLAEFNKVIMAVNTPISPNNGFLTHSQRKKHKPGKWPDVRRIEYELEEYGAPIYHTPKKKSNLLAAQQYGFDLIENLQTTGFRQFGGEEQDKVYFEAPAETAFWSIDRKTIFEGDSFIGRIQRQLLLLELGFQMPDPMDFFEEVTRFKLKTGKAPLDMILDMPRLNAWICAYTAWQQKQNPSRTAKLGYPQEGFIYLPFQLPEWEDPDTTIQETLF